MYGFSYTDNLSCAFADGIYKIAKIKKSIEIIKINNTSNRKYIFIFFGSFL